MRETKGKTQTRQNIFHGSGEEMSGDTGVGLKGKDRLMKPRYTAST